jgi:putative transposase
VGASKRVSKPGFPVSRARNSFTYKQFGNGARRDNGFLVLSAIGRIKVGWSRPMAGTLKTATLAQEGDGW